MPETFHLNPTQRRAVELFAPLINQELASGEEAISALAAAAGQPPLGSAARCRIAWALHDAVKSEAIRHAKAEAEARIAAWKNRGSK